jgi:phenylalanyl-tRNA synthetase beta chain
VKISLQWLSDYLEGKEPFGSLLNEAARLREELPLSGLEIGYRHSKGDNIAGVVTAQILSFQRHPNADRLNVCKVKVSDKEQYEIVCGASNVREGMIVALARENTVLPGNFKIVKSKIRGVESNGMLCSEKELGLSEESKGILDLAPTTPIGIPLVDALALKDEVWEFELTPDRADCLSYVGIAREMARFVGMTLKYPTIEKISVDATSDVPLIGLDVQAKKACPLYYAQLFEGFQNVESPSWLKSKLEAIGSRPKNALVDLTNFVLFELGQPLHSFDADKITGSKIVVRFAKDGEKIVILDGTTLELCKEDLVIADVEKPLALAGVMGSLDSGVTETTKRVVLEAAYFDPEVIRATVQRYKLHSDASHRFERGVDPQGVFKALCRISHLYKETCHARRRGVPVSAQAKNFEKSLEPAQFNFDLRALTRVTGLELNSQVVIENLASVEIEATNKSTNVIRVMVPTFRVDLQREIDLVEEVTRLVGYDQVPTRFPKLEKASEGLTTPYFDFLQKIRKRMLGSGLIEMMPYAFHSEKEKSYSPSSESVALKNPLSEDWKYLRSNLSVGLLRSLALTASRGEHEGRYFEASSVFQKRSEESKKEVSPALESLHVSWALMGRRYSEHWSTDKSSVDRKTQVDFYDSKSIANLLIEGLGAWERRWLQLRMLPLWKLLEEHGELLKSKAPWIPVKLLHPGKSAIYFSSSQSGFFAEVHGYVGELHPLLRNEILNVATGQNINVSFGEIRVVDDIWHETYTASKRFLSGVIPQGSIQLGSKFPVVQRDLAFVFAKDVMANDVIKTLEKEIGNSLLEVQCLDRFPLEDSKFSLAFRLMLQNHDKTFEDAEIQDIVKRCVDKVEKRFSATQRA